MPAGEAPLDSAPVKPPEAGARFLFACLALFAASGCAALIYEIVWFQLLELVIGSSGVSLGILLATYMGGLCLGSALLARFVPRSQHPLKVYALLELGIAVFGVAALFGTPVLGRVYLAGPVSGTTGLIFRGVLAAVCLVPPTLLMGASLPALSRWVETTPKGVSWLGLLYSANIGGAVTGCLLAGFYLLRVYDLGAATYSAAAINLAVAGLAWTFAVSAPGASSADLTEAPPAKQPDRTRRSLVQAAIALSGLTALGAEVVWTRLLSLLLGGTVYTFSIILAVFLIGLWGGSVTGAVLSRRISAAWGLAGCQALLAAAIAWTAFTITSVLPYWPVDPWLSLSPWFNFDLDFSRCLRAILPPALLWGASFPLALAAAAAEGEDPARLSGSIYAINTAGSILGALAFSLVLIPWIGTRGSQELLVWLAAAGAIVAVFAAARQSRLRARLTIPAAAAAALLFAWVLSASVEEMPWQAVAYGRRIAPILRGMNAATDVQARPLFVGEGINSSVVIAERAGQRVFYVSGKSEASSAPIDMRLQRMMGHLPALFHRDPKSVLVVGFGAGVTAGSFVPYPEVQSIVVCELEPLIPPASGQHFAAENNHVLTDRRTRIVYDDARHFILTTPEKFDVITTDPIHPWIKGTSALYSKQYYELVKSHLNPGGVVAQWLPIYESDEETVRTELATFFSVFPNATVWSNFYQDDGYDLVLLGREDSTPIDIGALQQRLDRADYKGVAASLAEVQFHSAAELLGSFAGRARDLRAMLEGVPLNEDSNLRLQYLAGLGVNALEAPEIYRRILTYRRFPEDLLTGKGEGVEALRARLARRYRVF
jgi:spermidine synthase